MKYSCFLNKVGKMLLLILLYLMVSFTIYSIVDYWFFCRFFHVSQYLDGISNLSPLEKFLRKRNSLSEIQCLIYFYAIFLMTILIYCFMRKKMTEYKNKRIDSLYIVNLFFCISLFVITNLRFFGDTGNINVDKVSVYYLLVAIPSYIFLFLFCVIFMIVLSDRDCYIDKIINVMLKSSIFRVSIFLFIAYFIYYTTACILEISYSGTFVSLHYFRPFLQSENMVKTNYYILIFANLMLISMTYFIYAWIMKMFKQKCCKSAKTAFYNVVKIFVYMLSFSITIRYYADLTNPEGPNIPREMAIDYIYWPLITTCTLFLFVIRQKIFRLEIISVGH